jgi:copper(I)-binding protein
MKMGYDGILIKGREMVNFKPEHVMYFQNERQLILYYESQYGD